MIILKSPIKEKDILALKIGDKVLLSGIIFTARDEACKFLSKNNFKKINNSIIYHCGPIVKNNIIISAGPTTSARFNYYTPKLIKKYKIRAIIGKGGMDNTVLNSLKGKAVYLSAIGGVAVLYAEAMEIKNIYKKEFGMTEAIWEFEVKNFPVMVTMDSKGNSLHDDIYRKSEAIFKRKVFDRK
jgi:fumarate hydratase subunit beta